MSLSLAFPMNPYRRKLFAGFCRNLSAGRREHIARVSLRPIIVPAHTMAAALAIARFRPQAPLVVVASSMRLYRSLALVRGVSPLLSAAFDTGTGTGTGPQACLVQAREWLVSQGLAEPGDQVVLVFASSSACERADSLRTIRLSPDGSTG